MNPTNSEVGTRKSEIPPPLPTSHFPLPTSLNAALDELNGISAEAAAALQSPWEPACLARAFATRPSGALALTMQQWIDLEAIRSPLLLEGDEVPEYEQFVAALEIFGLALNDETPAVEMADLLGAMRRAVREAFALNLPMKPEKSGDADDGFGTWLPIFTALIVECGLSVAEARGLDVGQAFALLAGLRRIQNWHVAGTPYALREIQNSEFIIHHSGEEAARG